MGGLSRRSTKIKELRSSNENPLILDAGDLFFSTKDLNPSNKNSETVRAQAIMEGYQKIGCDVINVGHYEVLNGLSFLNQIIKRYNIPFISANLKNAKTNELIFKPYEIFERDNLKIGVVGVTDMLPDTCKSIVSEDYINKANEYGKKISEEVDLLIALVNAQRSAQSSLVEKLPMFDFIITSGSTNMSRANSPQVDDGPYIYSCGKQGKYLLTIDLDLRKKNTPFVDISAQEKKIRSINKRFERLQKKDPNMPLESIYENQQNILNLIKQYKEDIKQSEQIIASAVNTLEFQTIPLSRSVEDDEEILAFVNKSVETCNALAPKASKSKKVNRKKIDSHAGHEH